MNRSKSNSSNPTRLHQTLCDKLESMCGRYRLTAKERYIAEHFGVEEEDVEWTPRYNIAPTQPVATVRQDRKEPRRKFALMRWGLIPFWAKDASIGARTINAVSETAAEKPAFREAMQRGRCLIPADGFYEWKKLDRKSKQPYCVTMADDSLFAFAGLWDRWRPPAGEAIATCGWAPESPIQSASQICSGPLMPA